MKNTLEFAKEIIDWGISDQFHFGNDAIASLAGKLARWRDDILKHHELNRYGETILSSDPRLQLNVADLELSVRCWNRLHNAEIETLRDLVVLHPRNLLGMYMFGKKSLVELIDVLRDEHQLSLGMRILDDPAIKEDVQVAYEEAEAALARMRTESTEGQ